ncbi:hypothetical protein BpHYR1_048774 [Brachionus plicatilis]|uniref:Uncharacterized protein n=1 Tax=Brachionus plicatilis TaxID=10195 RepID=A0A3M7SFE6_BRAPC|nr:hypothetical protein BpHYR1_048774 [Brachionus plicatilis]
MKITRLMLLLKFLSFANSLVQNHLKNFGNFKTKKLSDCKAELDDGRIVDLSSLDNPSNPISVIYENQEYFYNPCTAIECDPNSIKNTAICQKIKDSHEEYNCGEQNTAFFDFKNNNLYISYTSRDRPAKNYFLNLKSPCCCPNKCNGKKPTKSGGLSLGSVLLIM